MPDAADLIDDIETAAERVRMCLAEAGYPDAPVWAEPCESDPSQSTLWISINVPRDVAHRAFDLAVPGDQYSWPNAEPRPV